MSPKVFVSHASEDKDRFVLQFAERLRQKGIDAWLDKWEMLPGDSLVDKIFEEGIKEAKAVIVVLSKFSVEKPWVREELNAAFVKRINNGSKLIPIVIDDCEVPEALKSTLWEPIADLSAYDKSFDRIVASIYGANDRPPIGPQPEYVQSFVQAIGNLNNIDSLVLRFSCEEVLKTGNAFVNPERVFLKDDKPILPEDELKDSLEILDGGGYIKLMRTLGGGFFPYQITTYGFDVYANASIPDYQGKIAAVVSAIVNEKLMSNAKIQERLKENKIIVDHILNVLENKGHIKQSKMIGGLSEIFNVSPSLKRALSGG
ncbi:MAG TPA: toll/interleukin-1 receptor domain-containing protein [Chlorobaculum sp.]|uniref:TIR domain protein n=1 Tax=Chlorobaculum tepidum (strain ATCC 49652 / DSM 12025 / NBRC 103806 / TLS) TaxID=194439 RepID=Q8KCF6_CHLTE|nr:toll/interleukin-1 receptor domain-containing protein [Chlorobaculum tepidum]AAM72693.1 TIR domain protein [Chlorobaculum tepidum TLS]HBU22644.1 toll/interleukin-1 receptor domain-containing protein [Chlorobaculum sp.]